MVEVDLIMDTVQIYRLIFFVQKPVQMECTPIVLQVYKGIQIKIRLLFKAALFIIHYLSFITNDA